jgi:CubicO group peptidase (beta-lactamase class C family)
MSDQSKTCRTFVSWLCITLLLLAFPLAALAVEPEPLSPDTQKALEAAVMKELKAYGGKDPIPGAIIGVWIPGKAPFMKGIGLSDISSSKPIAIDDKVRVGSNTKTFVVTVLLQLIDEKNSPSTTASANSISE